MTAKPLAWITGANGLIGNYLAKSAPQFASQWLVRRLTHQKLDLLDSDAVRREFQRDKPQLIIHCAALTRTQECQAKPALAHRLNVEMAAKLAELAAGIPFIFFSTDLAFDGQKGNYVETDPVNPVGIYAQTKVAAEQIVLANPGHTVIRTSLNAGQSLSGDHAFNEQIRLAFEAGKTLTLFTDEFRQPIPAAVTARAAWELAEQGATGLFHVAGGERLSRWQIGQLLAARWSQLHPRIEPESLKAYQGAPRAPDTSLNCAKAQKLLSFPLPKFSEWLAAHPGEEI